jgi:hypothetical protein
MEELNPREEKTAGSWREVSRSNGIRTVHCPDFVRFFQFVDKGFGDGDLEQLWRGQRDARWEIVSSLARTGKDASWLLSSYRNAVARATHVEYAIGDGDFSEAELRLWSLGQHHGLLTPLTDWTVYPYVALFFAFAEPDTAVAERAVFALNWHVISVANFHVRYRAESFRTTINEPPYDAAFQAYLTQQYGSNFGEKIECVARSDIDPIARERLCKWETAYQKRMQLRTFVPRTNENPRIHSQGGHHVYTPDAISIETWISQQVKNGHVTEREIALTKITIPNDMREEVLRALSKMNINFLSLFPDFEGAARHCNMALFNEAKGLFRFRDY